MFILTEVDSNALDSNMSNESAIHLLQSALTKAIGHEVCQSAKMVNCDIWSRPCTNNHCGSLRTRVVAS